MPVWGKDQGWLLRCFPSLWLSIFLILAPNHWGDLSLGRRALSGKMFSQNHHRASSERRWVGKFVSLMNTSSNHYRLAKLNWDKYKIRSYPQADSICQTRGCHPRCHRGGGQGAGCSHQRCSTNAVVTATWKPQLRWPPGSLSAASSSNTPHMCPHWVHCLKFEEDFRQLPLVASEFNIQR